MLAKTDFESVCACVEREKLLERHCCKPKRKRILELNSSSLRSVFISGGAHVRRDRDTARFVPIYIQTCSWREQLCTACFYSPAYIKGVFANGVRVRRICIEPVRFVKYSMCHELRFWRCSLKMFSECRSAGWCPSHHSPWVVAMPSKGPTTSLRYGYGDMAELKWVKSHIKISHTLLIFQIY